MSRSVSITLLSLAALSLAGIASAGNLTFTGVGAAEIVTITDNNITANAYHGAGAETAYSGILNFNNGSGTIQTVCTNIFEDIVNGNADTYNVGSTTPGGGTKLDMAGSIVAKNFSAVVASGSNAQACGLQLAVWQTLFGSDAGFSMSGASSSALSYEAQFLGDVNYNGSATTYTASAYGPGQDQISANAVPEPMTMGVLATGIVGLISRKRRKA